MKVLILLVFIPNLIVADIICPNSKTLCPEDKRCCKADGEYSCCAPDDEQDVTDKRVEIFPGDELLSAMPSENSLSANESTMTRYCDHSICPFSCCDDGCCFYVAATCCGGRICCPASSTCCNPGCCLDLKRAFLLLIFIPSLITADTLCPNSKTTCPEDKQCCEIEGKYACCDPADGQDKSDIRKKIIPGVEIMSPVMSSATFSNSSFFINESAIQNGVMCDLFCSGTCCDDGCCKYKRAACCDDDGCCPSLHTCCGTNCCDKTTKCCLAAGGCCPKGGACCGDACCRAGFQCCGSWCCSKIASCGVNYLTCESDKGAIVSTNIYVLLLLVASIFVIY